jgi:hypothetical protein
MKPIINKKEVQIQEVHTLFEATNAETLISAHKSNDTEEMNNKHTILLHGWGNNIKDLVHWEKKLLDENIGGYVWKTQYDTGKSFDTVAASFIKLFKSKESEGYVFNDVRILAYSMGGLVARKMMALGFRANLLTSVCSPHEGLMNQIPAINDGVKSLKKNSKEITAITNDPIDIKNRNKFMFRGFNYTCTGNNTSFDDDTVVDLYSATGNGLGDLISRNTIHWNYPDKHGPIWFTDNLAPHRLPLREEFTNDAIGDLIPLFK